MAAPTKNSHTLFRKSLAKRKAIAQPKGIMGIFKTLRNYQQYKQISGVDFTKGS